ncbi:MAG: NAD(P)-binding domain-containing protein [Trueperaceae bacterium]|nr:NAD(P)-binding domain-containing protein [Trueperaceae bacterium]
MTTSPLITIIGAGPAGLALGYHLQQRSLPFRILEREVVGASWHHHYDHLDLHTVKAVSGLPGWPMPEDYPTFPDAAQFRRYLKHYAEHFELPIETGVEVTEATFQDGCWTLGTNRGTYRSELLVTTTGIAPNPYRPHFPGEDAFQGEVIHSQQYQRPEDYRGQKVLVVGTGNSGAEITAALADEGVETGIAVRSGVLMVPYPTSGWSMRLASWLARHLPQSVSDALLRLVRKDFRDIGLPLPDSRPTETFPVVGFELAEAVERGDVRVHRALESFTAREAEFRGGEKAAYDVVILATGYRPALGFVADEVAFDEEGWPLLDGYRSSRNPQLFCVGYDYPNTEGWLQALPRVSRAAAAQVARTWQRVESTGESTGESVGDKEEEARAPQHAA